MWYPVLKTKLQLLHTEYRIANFGGLLAIAYDPIPGGACFNEYNLPTEVTYFQNSTIKLVCCAVLQIKKPARGGLYSLKRRKRDSNPRSAW